MNKLFVTGDDSQIIAYYMDGIGNITEVPLNTYNYYNDSEGDIEIDAKSGYVLESVLLDGNSMPIENNTCKFHFVFDTLGVNEIDVTSSGGNQPPKDVSGFNYLYLVDRDKLKSLASERFVTDGVDLGTYIINLLELPFVVNEEIKGTENPIVLGNTVANTKAVEIRVDEIQIDLGDIIVPNKYNNSYDFINTETKLHLPFVNTIDLDINYVIGHTINIQYIIDLYYGDMTINIRSSKTNNIIHSESAKIGRNIPFIRKINGDSINSLSTKNGVNNGIFTPFIEVIRNVPYQQNNEFKNEVITHEPLQNIKGYVTVSNMVLNSKATQNEKDSIINLLGKGVYIK
jgi:hypothetical protein